MRVLWFCNVPMAAAQHGSGSWLASMAEGLAGSGDSELGIISFGTEAAIRRCDHGALRQWLIPRPRRLVNGLPPAEMVEQIRNLCGEFSSDVIHVWGTELYFGLLTARGHVPGPALLTVQGLKSTIGRAFNGQLSWAEQLRCIGLREAVRRTTILRQKRRFSAWTRYENEILAGHKWVSCQTPWQAAYVKLNRNDATIFEMDLPLRPSFQQAQWGRPLGNHSVFCSAGYAAPFKGLHVAIRALAILKRRYPSVELRLAGPAPSQGIRRDGYLHWVAGEISAAGLEENVRWLGSLSGEQMAHELQTASVALIPSFVESYSMALAEAMMVGTPTVVSFTGGTSHLGRDGETCLFFPPGDETMCAYQLDRVLADSRLSVTVSANARQVARERNHPGRIIEKQLAIYRGVMKPVG